MAGSGVERRDRRRIDHRRSDSGGDIGAVVSRNAGRGRAIYDFSPFLEKDFLVAERVHLRARAEAFNVFNHPNFVGYSGTYGNEATPGAGFGLLLTGITNQLPARSLQFSVRLMY